jgi:hypothetical protein
MMTDIGNRVDKTQAQMNGVMRQLGKLLKTNGDACVVIILRARVLLTSVC